MISNLDIFRHKNAIRERTNKAIALTVKNVAKIKRYSGTKEVKYPEYKEAFDYVDNLFPKTNIKEVIVLQVSALFLSKIGYGGVGGFYDRISKTVVFASHLKTTRNKWCICGKIKKDEVLVHELIHYCYFDYQNSSNSVGLTEEFAYGWSLGYLQQKGYTNDEIIKNNYLPYLFQVAKQEIFVKVLRSHDIDPREFQNYRNQKKYRIALKYNKEIHTKSLKLAMEQGRILVDIYDRKINGSKIDKNITINKVNRFGLLDIE